MQVVVEAFGHIDGMEHVGVNSHLDNGQEQELPQMDAR